jgi:two-component system response regulator HydG
VRLFIEEANATYGRSVRGVSEEVLRRLVAYSWPGNIRQLRNVIANAVILSEGETISGLAFDDGAAPAEELRIDGDLRTTMARHSSDLERRIIRTVLDACGGNVTRCASRLGISRKTLYEKMRRHGMWPAPQMTPAGRSST